ncbi:MAG: carbon dioxide concentrating mechanism protein [Cyanobacteria bacterium]|nr:carbon dioxide concentrating mechanism protein [Cyanobacteriota bacterium]
MSQAVAALDAAAFYVAGAVTIAPDVAIAPGAVLKALPGSCLVIRARACIGTGVIIQAQQGTLTLEEGVSLGAGVLVVGRGVIGAHACVGAESTLLDPTIGKSEVLPARSLLGDQSRTLASPPESSSSTTDGTAAHDDSTNRQPQAPVSEPAPEPRGSTVPAEDSTPLAGAATVYGREHIAGLIQTLFPHRQPLSTANSENNSIE